ANRYSRVAPQVLRLSAGTGSRKDHVSPMEGEPDRHDVRVSVATYGGYRCGARPGKKELAHLRPVHLTHGSLRRPAYPSTLRLSALTSDAALVTNRRNHRRGNTAR